MVFVVQVGGPTVLPSHVTGTVRTVLPSDVTGTVRAPASTVQSFPSAIYSSASTGTSAGTSVPTTDSSARTTAADHRRPATTRPRTSASPY